MIGSATAEATTEGLLRSRKEKEGGDENKGGKRKEVDCREASKVG